MQTKIYPAPAAPSTKIDAADIAARLGLHRSRPDEFRGRCPSCSYDNAAVLTVKAGKPLLWCSSCGDRAALAAVLRAAAGGVLPSPAEPRAAASDAERRAARIARARQIWDGAEAITADSPAGMYLERRMIQYLVGSAVLRWRLDTPHPSGGRRIALLAEITGADGSFAGIQRIFLKQDGTKADVEPAKASIGLIAGGAVRLQPCSDTLAVGEGIETSAAAGAILKLPAWAAISCGNLGRSMILPAEIRSVTIAVDHDAPGQAAARQAWRRWRAEGRHVRLATPKEAGSDFGDLAMGAGR